MLVATAAGLLPCLQQAAFAVPRIVDDQPAQRPFTAHWMVNTHDREVFHNRRIDWQALVNFGDVPIQRDSICLYEHWFALEVREGGLSVTRQSGFRARYAENIRRLFDLRVPQGFAGLVCIDIEFAAMTWGNRTGGPGLYPTQGYGTPLYDDWFRHIQAVRPELIRGKSVEEAERALADSYDAAVRDFFTATIEIMRSLRPDAKFGFYNLPFGTRYGQYAWPAPNLWRDTNDRLRWMVDLADVQFIPLYQNRITLPDGVPASVQRGEVTIAESRAFIDDNVREARRLSPTKPIYVLAMCRYPETAKQRANQWLDALALDSMFRRPRHAGADGVIIWDMIPDEAGYNALNSYITQFVLPILAEVVTRPPTTPEPPPPPPPQPPSPPEPPSPPQPPSPPEPPSPPQPPSPPEPPSPPQPPSPPEPPSPPQPPSPPEPPSPPQPPAFGDEGGMPPNPPAPSGSGGDGSGNDGPPSPPAPNPFARGGGRLGGGGSGGDVSPPTPSIPPGATGGSSGGGQGQTGGGTPSGGTGGGGSGDQGFRPVSPGTGGGNGGEPIVGPSPDRSTTVTPAPARRIGVSKGGRVIDLVPRTKVVTGATLLRRPVIEQVAPTQIRTRNLTPTPILAASAGTSRSVATRQPVRTTVWWKRMATADHARE